ncbi:MAG: protein-export chaperone SecB [Geminicoccaceae bacterium]
MSDAPQNPASSDPEAGAAKAQTQPRLSILQQYVKDLSFENPRAPLTFQAGQARPEIQVHVDVSVRDMTNDRYEISLKIDAEAKVDGNRAFFNQLDYCGIFVVSDLPENTLQPVLLIECPRLLFPFARRIIADCTRDGGFPPLMLDPVDFVSLYRRRLEQAKASQAAEQAAGQTPQTPLN